MCGKKERAAAFQQWKHRPSAGKPALILAVFFLCLSIPLLLLPGCQVLEEMELVRPASPVTVNEEKGFPGELEPLEGRLQAARQARISVPAPGRVESVRVMAGQEIAAGDELLVMDDREAYLNLQKARAELALVEAEAERLQGRDELYLLEREIAYREALLEHKTLEKEYSVAQHLYETDQITAAELEEIEAAATLAELRLNRQQILLEQLENGEADADAEAEAEAETETDAEADTDAVDGEDADTAADTATTEDEQTGTDAEAAAAAEEETGQADGNEVEEDRQTAEAERLAGETEQLKPELARARAAYELASKRYEQCRVEAPIDGRVSEIRVNEGEWLQAGETVLVIQQADPVKLALEVKEEQLGHFVPGETIQVQVPALQDAPLPGTVAGISYLEQGLFTVDIHLENPADRLRPGMTARVDLAAMEQARQEPTPGDRGE